MKTSEMLSFLTLNFLLASISAIMSSNTINTFLFLLDYNLLSFHKIRQLFVNNQ